MKPIRFVKPTTISQAAMALRGEHDHALAGGMDLIPTLQENVVLVDHVVNLKTIHDPSLRGITQSADGIRIGALTTLTDIAEHSSVRRDYAALAEAAEEVGSPQIRNVGTLGGNLCQRPRCWYFRNENYNCLKKGGSRCFANEEDADNEFNAILGGGPAYIVHPSNCATALVALDATIGITGPDGSRTVAVDSFFVLPRVRLMQENVLNTGEIVTHVTIPHMPHARSAYIQFANREAFDWAISGAAVRASFQDGKLSDGRVVLHAVAPIPWRAKEAESLLNGRALDAETRSAVAEAALQGAQPLSKNAYKVPLTKAMVRDALARIA